MEKATQETEERGWGLLAFIMGLEDLDDEEKKLCYDALDKEGFGARTKHRAFLALDDAELRDAGIRRAAVRKVLRLAMGRAESAAAGSLTAAAVAPDEAAMMRALCSKAVPAPGEVLRLEGAGFVPDVDLGEEVHL
ncbi:hypothetical protein HXX76_006323 [Chlamydomonas incerta]|uniref:Uncharacterized protein n=1 Tax=Chlamydomonas incerta TaxID=51695 RepID=A0A835W4I2_CHLIN|nr:hypothetical protein HXX76_006323 [Chlamydomonas incerta]|eukprot:KAG2436799.1 hypothetical protein HXX76_006323 [Chlamydomonas incerta]